MTTVPPQCIDLIARFEGFVPKPYKDPVGILSIGFGHVVQPGEEFTEITEEEGKALLQRDAALRGEWVLHHIKAPLNDNQFSALVSLVFNVGTGPLVGTLGKLLNQFLYEQAAEEFPRWHFAGGRSLPGLVARREAEKELFLTPPKETL